MDTIVVNDTNIFIDLISVNLLDEFFQLPIQIHTTDLVIHELEDPVQKQLVLTYISKKKLIEKKHSAAELSEIAELKNNSNNNVSIADCSVWLYAMKNQYTLLTGDAKLRKSASHSGVKVCGILKIFDMLVDEHQIIPMEKGAEKLAQLFRINNRLPSQEIRDRISKWGS